jgi:hypothetical protein
MSSWRSKSRFADVQAHDPSGGCASFHNPCVSADDRCMQVPWHATNLFQPTKNPHCMEWSSGRIHSHLFRVKFPVTGSSDWRVSSRNHKTPCPTPKKANGMLTQLVEAAKFLFQSLKECHMIVGMQIMWSEAFHVDNRVHGREKSQIETMSTCIKIDRVLTEAS